MTTIEQMKKAVQSGSTRILTIQRARELTGKRIATIYFDFEPKHQHVIDEFIVGEVKTEYDLHPDQKSVLKELKDKPHLIRKMKSTWEIITDEGRRTLLRADAYNSGIFTGPNIDFEVWFKEV